MERLHKEEQDQYERMTTAPVSGLILSLALPSIVTMLITSVYNLADTFFVGRIGTSATGAVGVVFSIPMILNALGFLVGTGASSLMSRMLGAKDQEGAQRVTSTGFFLSFLFGLMVAVIGFAAGESLMTLLGATDTILPYAMAYGRYIFFGAPFAASSLALSQCLRGEGMSRESMMGQVLGGVLNMVLDPLFIFVFRLGIAGAAMATALSQFVSWGILISFYIRRKTQVHISIRFMSRTAKQYLELFSNGFPSLSRHGCNMIANVVLNWVAGGWGDEAIAAMSVCSRLLYLSNAVSLGLGQGAQPVFGYSHGAGNHRRVKEAFWFTAKAGMLSMCFFGVVGLIFAPQLIGLFRDDEEVIRIGSTAFRLICVVMPFASFVANAGTMFQMIGRPLPSTLLILSRQLFFYIPALMALPKVLGLFGLQLSGPLADILAACMALPMINRYFRTAVRPMTNYSAD